MISAALLALVKASEGLRLDPYICPAGYPSIGYGHRIGSLQLQRISEARALQLLEGDIAIAQASALRLCPHLTGMRLDALTDLCFNVGRDALDGVSPSDLSDDAGVIKCLRAEDWTGAAARFRRWDHAKVWDPVKQQSVLVELRGLKARREVGAQWILGGGG